MIAFFFFLFFTNSLFTLDSDALGYIEFALEEYFLLWLHKLYGKFPCS